LFVVLSFIGVDNNLLLPKIDHDITDDDDTDDCIVDEAVVSVDGNVLIGLSVSSSNSNNPSAFCISTKFTTHTGGLSSDDDDDDDDFGRANAHDRCAYIPHATHWSIPPAAFVVAAVVHSR
jgi:hypothetical protein